MAQPDRTVKVRYELFCPRCKGGAVVDVSMVAPLLKGLVPYCQACGGRAAGAEMTCRKVRHNRVEVNGRWIK